ncbi:MAG TPA: DNA polymerase III subunit gamma/tau [Candidatus Paceibacterota bacterium]|jgi:DNA polymerase-3 subunit gamma/tau|nr:DNA polymerase III subunit gamma/tau [Candidatus Paceibacterota bacterium]
MHQSLYRKYRPHAFEDVAGQDQVIAPLQAQIEGKSVGHAYLFAGSRGLGKTSIARIFARELGTQDADLYEIDAASNNSVDDIRALTENVYTLPFASPYKVYILDEAHMLSKGAWNAFLKTLEEPPAHAIFILATTELEKVPETVQSRCQVFQFMKPSRAGLAALIAEVGKKEKVTIEPSAADLIALLGDGSYRDALSVLEKVIASANGTKISREDAERATGAPKHALVQSLIVALSHGDQEAALGAIQAAAAAEVNMPLYLTLVLERLRLILLARHAPELRKEIQQELGADEYAELEVVASAKDSKLTHRTLRVFLEAASRMRFSPIPQLPLELAVLESAESA